MTNIKSLWTARHHAREISSTDIAALCIYRSIKLGEDTEQTKARLCKSFSPVRNKIKLDNGAYPYLSLTYSLNMIKYSCLADWLAPEEFASIAELAKSMAKEKFE